MVDGTGVGRPVVDMLRAAGAAPTPVSITHRGRAARDQTGAWSVPKAVLMERMAMAMDQGRLKIICDERMGRVFAGEARNFVRRVNKLGHGTYAGQRRSHDDLILAVALAIWARAEHSFAGDPSTPLEASHPFAGLRSGEVPRTPPARARRSDSSLRSAPWRRWPSTLALPNALARYNAASMGHPQERAAAPGALAVGATPVLGEGCRHRLPDHQCQGRER
jgi:hypothetical protein